MLDLGLGLVIPLYLYSANSLTNIIRPSDPGLKIMHNLALMCYTKLCFLNYFCLVLILFSLIPYEECHKKNDQELCGATLYETYSNFILKVFSYSSIWILGSKPVVWDSSHII